MFVLSCFSVLLITVSIIYLYALLKTAIINRRNVIKFPARKANFFLGHVFYFNRNPEKLFYQFRQFAKDFPNGYSFWFHTLNAYNFIKAEDVEILLSNIKYIKKESLYVNLYPWLKRGLLTSGGEKWKNRRRILTPSFHFNILRKFVAIFGEHNEKFSKIIEQESQKNKTNIVPLISKLTLDLISETAMGVCLDENTEAISYRKAVHRIGQLVVSRNLRPWLAYDLLYFLTPEGRECRKYLNILHEFTSTIIKEREKIFVDSEVDKIMEGDKDDDNDDIVYKKKKFAMLDLMISAKRRTGEIDDAGIREEVDTFMFEGHDTTSITLCFTILMLANHKNIQERVVEEQKEIFKDSTLSAGCKELQKMHYLEMCIKETLRLFPSVPFISRTLDYDMPIRKGEYVIPKDSMVHVHIFDLHRDPKVFPNPEKYDPDRFLPENSQNRHPYAYIPFSAGPRNCIGQKFAMLEVKSVLSSILRRYEILPVDSTEDIRFKMDLVLRTTDEVYVKFKKRNLYM